MRLVNRRRFIGSLTAAGAVGVAGCLGDDTDDDDDEVNGTDDDDGDDDGEMETTTLQPGISHYPITPHGVPYLVALEHGWYEEEGIVLEDIVSPAGGGHSVRTLVTGDLPFADLASTAIPPAFMEGAAMTVVSGGVNQLADMAWASVADSDVEEIQDLEGGSLAYTSPQSITQISGMMSIDRADGIDPDDVEFIASGGVGEGLTLLREGEVDVCVYPEPGFTASQDDYNLVFRGNDYIPEFAMSFVAVGPVFLEQNPGVVESLNSVRKRTVDWIKENPEETGRMWAGHLDYDADIAAEVVSEVFPEDEWSDGTINVEGVSTVDEALHEFDFVDEEIPWDEIIDQSYLPEDMHVDLADI